MIPLVAVKLFSENTQDQIYKDVLFCYPCVNMKKRVQIGKKGTKKIIVG